MACPGQMGKKGKISAHEAPSDQRTNGATRREFLIFSFFLTRTMAKLRTPITVVGVLSREVRGSEHPGRGRIFGASVLELAGLPMIHSGVSWP
jgi:hypothetical protein